MKNQQRKNNQEVTMKGDFGKAKRMVCSYPCLLLGALFLSLLLLGNLSAGAEVEERNTQESLTPALIIIEEVGAGPGEEVGLHLSRKLVMNDFGITVGITPYLNKKELTGSEYLVEKLRELYDRYPEKISFALQGLEHLENELRRPLPEQIHILSRAQSIFTKAFNKNLGGYRLLATALMPPYGHYNSDTAASARQAGIKVIIGSEFYDPKGYALLEGDVVEVHPDKEASMIADWQSLKIKSPQELIKSMSSALKESSLENPLVMIINVGILYNQFGPEDAKRYIDTLTSLLDQLRQREKLRFITSAEFYQKFIGSKQYVTLRVDDYETPFKKELFEKENIISRSKNKITNFYSYIPEKLRLNQGITYTRKEINMLVFSIISFILAGLSFMGGLVNQGSIRLSLLTGSILFLIVAVGLILRRRATRRLKKDVSRDTQVSEKTERESEMAKFPSVPERPGTFLREQDMVFGPDGKGAFSVSFWFEEDLANNQEYLGMKELHYLFLEFEGDYKLIKRKEEINGKDYIVYTFQSGYQVDFNQSRYINFEEREDKSYLLEIKIGKLSERIIRGKADTLVIKVTLPAKINIANSMTYEDKTVEWRITGAHLTRDLTLKAFTLPFALL